MIDKPKRRLLILEGWTMMLSFHSFGRTARQACFALGLVALAWAMPSVAGIVTANTGGPYIQNGLNNAITLDASLSFSPDAPIASYFWDFDNSGRFSTVAYGPTTTFRGTAPGIYTIGLYVKDGLGTSSAQVYTTVEVGSLAPVARSGGPYSTFAGTSIHLNASGSFDPDGLALTYAWDLSGTGNFTDSALIDPLFSVAPGVLAGTSYLVCVRVSDVAKSAVSCSSVNVVAGPAVVAEPGSLMLLGIGLVAAAGIRRRRDM